MEDRAALAKMEARERVSRVEAESTTVLASTRGEAEGFTQIIALLEGELVKVCQVWESIEENFWGLSNTTTNSERWREESERECQEQVEELTVLQTRGSKLCLAIVGLPRVRNHLWEGMRIAALHHTKMAEQLVGLRVAVSSTAEFVFGCLRTEELQVEVADELVSEFRKLEEWQSRFEKPDVRVCNLILGSPFGQARLVNHLEEATIRLGAEDAARREADAELEALRTSATRVWNLVLERADGTSSLAVSLSSEVELLDDRIDTTVANGVHWGTRSTLVAVLSHIPELGTELELLGSKWNTDLTVTPYFSQRK
jgi:hypothetical protein